MDKVEALDSRDFKKCVEFHGHTCPGLAIGFRVAKVAMERLKIRKASDEELVAVVETDACGVDAIQVMTGCPLVKEILSSKTMESMPLP